MTHVFPTGTPTDDQTKPNDQANPEDQTKSEPTEGKIKTWKS